MKKLITAAVRRRNGKTNRCFSGRIRIDGKIAQRRRKWNYLLSFVGEVDFHDLKDSPNFTDFLYLFNYYDPITFQFTTDNI